MHILIVSSYFWPEDFRINDLAAGLSEKGHSVTVFTGIPNYPSGKFYEGYGLFSKRTEEYRGVRIIRYPQIPRGKGWAWNLMLNYLSAAVASCFLAPFSCRGPYDVIFVCQLSPVSVGLPAIVLKRLRSIPIVLWVLDVWPESLSATGAVRAPRILSGIRRFVRWMYGKCDRILVSSRGFEKSIAETGGYGSEVGYLPNWVEPEYLAASSGAALPVPELPAGFKVMFAGNIGEAQDFPTILAAAGKMLPVQDIHWVILGDGRKAEWVKSEVERRGLTARFHVLGRYPVDWMPSFFMQADALLLPLKRDPLFVLTAPGKLQSYLASGKPVIAALDGEGAKIVEEAGAGLTCPAESPEALADRVMRIYWMPQEERRRMGERGQAYCREHYDRDTLFARLERLLVQVSEENAVRPKRR